MAATTAAARRHQLSKILTLTATGLAGLVLGAMVDQMPAELAEQGDEITAEAGEDLAIVLTSEDLLHDLTVE